MVGSAVNGIGVDCGWLTGSALVYGGGDGSSSDL